MFNLIIPALIFAFVTLGAFFTYLILGTNKRLREHQIEWDKIKENSTNVHDDYMEYIDGLMKKYGGTILGACFPRM